MRKKEEKTVKWFYINCICIQVSQYNYMCIKENYKIITPTWTSIKHFQIPHLYLFIYFMDSHHHIQNMEEFLQFSYYEKQQKMVQ